MSDEGVFHESSDVTGSANSEVEPADNRQPTRKTQTSDGTEEERPEFGFRGWILVGWLVVALIVVPAYLYFFPRASETLSLFGLGYRDTYLFVPLLPALILGVLAVWATMRP